MKQSRRFAQVLTRDQVVFFNTFGYIVLPSQFSPSEVDVISHAFDDVMRNHICEICEENSFSDKKRHSVVGIVESKPELVKMLIDDRVYEPLTQLLNPGFIWVASDGNLYAGDTPWHSDKRPFPGYTQIKVSMYLDTVTQDTGCLRVIPGSHRQPINDILRAELLNPTGSKTALDMPEESYGISASELPCVSVESSPGDVVFFRQEIFHASFGGKVGRRMFAMGIFDRPTDENLIDSVSSLYTHHREQADESIISAFFNSDIPRVQEIQLGLREMGIE